MINKININNLIKLNLNKNKNYFYLNLNKNDFIYLNFFINLNLIKFIKKINKNKFLLYINKNPLKLKIINFYKPSKKIILTLKELKKINVKKKNFFIISTSSGLLLSNKACNLNKGGLLINSFNL